MAELRTMAGLHALVTGASGGLGSRVAVALADHGAYVSLLGRSESRLDETAAVISRRGGRCGTQPADLAAASIAEAASRVTAAGGPIDVLVNAAATHGAIAPLATSSADEWEHAIAVDLVAASRWMRAVLSGMIERRFGRIVNLSGGGAAAARPAFSAYAAAKAGLVRLTETVAAEVADFGITVNAVAPGALPTRLAKEIASSGAASAEERDALAALGEDAFEPAVDLIVALAEGRTGGLTGKLVSALHDPWRDWDGHSAEELNAGPLYTLRRLDPHTMALASGLTR